MKKLLNYKGLLVLIIPLSLFYYAYLKFTPLKPYEYVDIPNSRGGINRTKVDNKVEIERRKLIIEMLPYFTTGLCVLIGGVGYLTTKNKV